MKLKVHSVFHGQENTLSYLDPKIRDMIPVEMKKLTSIGTFKKEVKKWKPLSCPYTLCKSLYPLCRFYLKYPSNMFCYFVFILIYILLFYVHTKSENVLFLVKCLYIVFNINAGMSLISFLIACLKLTSMYL